MVSSARKKNAGDARGSTAVSRAPSGPRVHRRAPRTRDSTSLASRVCAAGASIFFPPPGARGQWISPRCCAPTWACPGRRACTTACMSSASSPRAPHPGARSGACPGTALGRGPRGAGTTATSSSSTGGGACRPARRRACTSAGVSSRASSTRWPPASPPSPGAPSWPRGSRSAATSATQRRASPSTRAAPPSSATAGAQPASPSSCARPCLRARARTRCEPPPAHSRRGYHMPPAPAFCT